MTAVARQDELAAPPLKRRRSFGEMVRRALGRELPVTVAALVLLGVLVMAVLAPQLAPHDPARNNLRIASQPPAWEPEGSASYLLGTDNLGRDILSRIIWGARVSLVVGFVATAVSGAVGVTLGLLAGYYGSWVDHLVMRLADTQLSIPFILLAIVVTAAIGPSLQNIILVLGVTGWVVYARIVRGGALTLREVEFAQAARCLGASDPRIIVRHVAPNLIAPVIVTATFAVAQFIVAEAALSFLGLGVQPPTPTWGGMLADGREFLATEPWMATFPGLAIMLTVLAINVLGDWLRDRLDPRLR